MKEKRTSRLGFETAPYCLPVKCAITTLPTEDLNNTEMFGLLHMIIVFKMSKFTKFLKLDRAKSHGNPLDATCQDSGC